MTREEKRFRQYRLARWTDWFVYGAIGAWWELLFWVVTT